MGSSVSTPPSWSTLAVGTAVAIGGAALYRHRIQRSWKPNAQRAVLVTGCDRGLGYSLALHCESLGLTVMAAVLDTESPGAQQLAQRGPRVRVLQLDVTDSRSVQAALSTVQNQLNADPKLQLTALVNNAGVLVFGEFEWQTERQVATQLDVNLKGTMRVTKAFLPLLRGNTGRVVVVTSHCALAALPGLSVYAATKAGLQAWGDALRIEQAQYGVPVVQVVPGSFIHLSGILAEHDKNAKEMMEHLTEEDKQFYGDYPKRFHDYLKQVSAMGSTASKKPEPLPDPGLHAVFNRALLSVRPAHRYVYGPRRYAIYHTLFKIAPPTIRDWLIIRFTSLPAFRPK